MQKSKNKDVGVLECLLKRFVGGFDAPLKLYQSLQQAK